MRCAYLPSPRNRPSIVIAALLVTSLGVAAQQPRDGGAPAGPPPPPGVPRAVAPPAPVRDMSGASSQVGTGVIAGRITHRDEPSRPVRRAMVALASANITRRMAVTDDEGRFGFDGLPAGRYTIRLSKASYSATMYGGDSVRAQGLTIALADGQRITDLAWTMMRGTVVTGRVTDQRGVPIQGASVTTLERVVLDGKSTFRPTLAGSRTTDDRGIYRFYGFGMGDWVVVARVPGQNVTVATPDELRWAAERARGVGRSGASADPQGRTYRYANVFYPGVTDPAAATVLTFGMSEEKSGIDIVVPLVPTATIAGRILRADGTPAPTAQVIAMPAGIRDNPIAMARRAVVAADGTFSVEGVEPGRYTVEARGASQTGPVTGPGAAPIDLWASTEVELSGADLSNLALALQPAARAVGRVVFEPTAGTTPPDFSRVFVRAVAAGGPSMAGMAARPAADGTFELTGLAPGSYHIAATLQGTPAATPEWIVQSATAGGSNVLDEPLDVTGSGTLPPIEIRFTDRKSEVTGRLLDHAGQPVPEFSVIVFGTNPAHWRQGSRWIAQPMRPASDGRFTITGLPPGEYYLAALTRFDPQEWYTAPFLEQVVPGALRIRVEDGEQTIQDIRLR